MDPNSQMFANGGITAVLIFVGGIVYRYGSTMIGHRFVSKCCDRQFDVGIDIRDMPHTPPTSAVVTKPEETA